ncbi:MAG: Fibronectin type protein [Candidatus Saccharibacteria bacterium]|nr:Fibronectin type protein [Candidatus Saccharibacteria bacterium]
MVNKIRFSAQWTLPIIIAACLLALFVSLAHTNRALAITQIPTPAPMPGSYGIAATKLQAPPAQGATISTPGNGSSFSSSPTTVNGICPNGLLVQVYDNSVMVGSVMCTNGSFSVQVSLFSGTNELSSLVYDELDQAGPVSNIATVNYTNTQFSAFGALITLTSSYGRRAANAGNELTWPLQLSGGTGPYAFSIDWGDGTATELKSQPLAGLVDIAHTYKKAGIYQINIKVTDVNGVSAFLQVIGLSNGKVDATAPAATGPTTATTKILWIPAVIAVVLLFPAYWLGRRSQLVSLRNKMAKEQAAYKEE